jgi:hypothetical protein
VQNVTGLQVTVCGGRQRGTPNKKTVLRNLAIAAAASNPDLSPLEFLWGATSRRWNATAGLGLRIGERQEYRDFSF